MPSAKFLPFDSEHLTAASRVYRDCFNAPPWEDGWTLESASARLAVLCQQPTALGRVAFVEDRLVALAIGHSEPWLGTSHFYLSELGVDPGCQRRGLGDALMEDLLQALRALGVASVYLLTDHGTPAEAFFSHNGFEPDRDSLKLWRDI